MGKIQVKGDGGVATDLQNMARFKLPSPGGCFLRAVRVSSCRSLRGSAPRDSIDRGPRVRLGAKNEARVKSLETLRSFPYPYSTWRLPSLLSALLVSYSSLQWRPEVYCPDELTGGVSGSGR